jgi:hypothetical protein
MVWPCGLTTPAGPDLNAELIPERRVTDVARRKAAHLRVLADALHTSVTALKRLGAIDHKRRRAAEAVKQLAVMRAA